MSHHSVLEITFSSIPACLFLPFPLPSLLNLPRFLSSLLPHELHSPTLPFSTPTCLPSFHCSSSPLLPPLYLPSVQPVGGIEAYKLAQSAQEWSENPFLLYSRHERLRCHIPSVPPRSSWLSLFTLSIILAHPVLSNYLFSLYVLLPFFLSTISSHTYTLSFFARFIFPFCSDHSLFCLSFACYSLIIFLPLSTPLLCSPLRASRQIIPLPPRQRVIITLCHLCTWTGEEKVGTGKIRVD